MQGKVRRETVISSLRTQGEKTENAGGGICIQVYCQAGGGACGGFYQHLKELSGETVHIDGGYPVDIYESVSEILRAAEHNEYEEFDPVYQAFGDKALEEGFPQVAASFHQIAGIEKTHGDRFGQLADLLEENKLFINSVECKWMCLNCGFIFEGKEAPQECPVCQHDRGFFIRLELAPYTAKA
mgnify:CR=1 FL=1